MLGRQVKLGDLGLSILSGTVDARDLTVADDPQFSSEPFITAKVVHIGVQVRPLLLQRQILIESLEIEAPQIHLVRAANGAWNFSTLSRKAGSPTQAKQRGIPDFAVNSFRIKDGHARLENLLSASTSLLVDQIDMAVDSFALAKQFPFTLSAVLPGQATLNMNGRAGPINPQDGAKSTFDIQFALRHFDPVAAGLVDKSAGICVLADIDAHAVSDGSFVSSIGTLTLQTRPNAVPAPKQIDITYNITHSLSDSTGQLRNAALQTGKLTAHLHGTYKLQPGNITVDLTLAGDTLPIDELQLILLAVGLKVPNGSVLQGGTLTTHLTIVGPLQALVINGPIELTNIRLSGFNPARS
ncbi:MAG: hypothetical protein JWQ49_2712 [Edaphobacter sp.]|nr:hypothetical protein [Edaphobacter sp.]